MQKMHLYCVEEANEKGSRMNEIISVLENVSAGTALMWIIIIGSCLSGLCAASIKIYKLAEKWRTVANENEEKEEMLNSHEKKISELSNDVKEIKELVKESIKQNDEFAVAICRNTLWQIHQESMKQQYITREGLRTFIEIKEVYEARGGDDILHDKLEPEVMSLIVKD